MLSEIVFSFWRKHEGSCTEANLPQYVKQKRLQKNILPLLSYHPQFLALESLVQFECIKPRKHACERYVAVS